MSLNSLYMHINNRFSTFFKYFIDSLSPSLCNTHIQRITHGCTQNTWAWMLFFLDDYARNKFLGVILRAGTSLAAGHLLILSAQLPQLCWFPDWETAAGRQKGHKDKRTHLLAGSVLRSSHIQLEDESCDPSCRGHRNARRPEMAPRGPPARTHHNTLTSYTHLESAARILTYLEFCGN